MPWSTGRIDRYPVPASRPCPNIACGDRSTGVGRALPATTRSTKSGPGRCVRRVTRPLPVPCTCSIAEPGVALVVPTRRSSITGAGLAGGHLSPAEARPQPRQLDQRRLAAVGQELAPLAVQMRPPGLREHL